MQQSIQEVGYYVNAVSKQEINYIKHDCLNEFKRKIVNCGLNVLYKLKLTYSKLFRMYEKEEGSK